MNKRLAAVLKVFGVVVCVLAILVAVGPFLIPVAPLEGLGSAAEAAQAESDFVTVPFAGTDGIELHYLAKQTPAGTAETTFVLLHGSVFNAYTWDATFDFFAEQGRVIAYDQIPYGLSEKLVEGDWSGPNPYSADAAVEQLFALLDTLEVGKVVLVGNSYGGVLAVQAALARPERVSGLILVDPAVYVQEEMPAWLMNLPQVRHVGPLLAREIGQSEDFIRQTYLDPEQISAERMDRTLIHTQVANWDNALWEYLRVWGTNSSDYSMRIPQISQPVLVLSGDSDTVVPVEQSRRVDAELPQSELVILEACGHVPQEECPDLFETAVADWLSRQDW
ncbi:alpha/beta fold hydrolase [Candidatus Chloroploca sp. Khr17]|uniref:alpha/beta fold hydrolase n=1 Tax=Candidatus Chloroploca sp. Khr17 TaxID=2496869 RepID=UPI00101D07CB|nr:alpha/beta hydrolase [Candidatus Chloroploca sp. Khr17]